MLKDIRSQSILYFFFILLCIVFLGFESTITGDLYMYLSASSDLFLSPNIYEELYGRRSVFYYMGNPFLTVCLYPVTYFPFQLASVLWKLLNIFLLFRIWKIIESYFALSLLSTTKRNSWILISFGASIFIIYSNLHLVQLTIFMLYLSMEGIYQIFQKERSFLGASFISLAIAIKISPIVILPYLVYRKYYKTSFMILLICTLFIFLPAFMLGWEKNLNLWSQWWTVINPEASIFDMNNRKNHGLSALIATLFIENIQDNVENLTHRRHLIDLGKEKVVYLIYTVRIILVVLTLYFLRTKPFQRIINRNHQFWELSYLFLVIPLIFPQQRTYNFLFLLPAIAYIGFHLISQKTLLLNYKLKLYIFIFSTVLLNLELILGQFRKYYWHHKTITYAAILLLILLATIPYHLKERST